jgi:transposase
VEITALLSHPDFQVTLSTFEALPWETIERPSEPMARRRPQWRLTEAQVDELVDSYQAGSSVPELAGRLQLHYQTVTRYLEQRGIERRATLRKLTDRDVVRAAHLYRGGESLRTIGDHFQVNAETVRRELRRAGVQMRPPSYW